MICSSHAGTRSTPKRCAGSANFTRLRAAIRGKPPDERRRVRQEQARPLLGSFQIWLRSTLTTVSQKGDTAKAINYALNQSSTLTQYIDDGGVEKTNTQQNPPR